MTLSDLLESVARAIDPDVFDLPRINLYKARYDEAYAKAAAAIDAVRRHSGEQAV